MATIAAPPAQAEPLRDIAYGERARNQLKLYLPDGVDTPPLVVFIHGGRWFRNDKPQTDRLTPLAGGFESLNARKATSGGAPSAVTMSWPQ